jgi:hypothetical protein
MPDEPLPDEPRTPVPPRADLIALRAELNRRKKERMTHMVLKLETFESLLLDAECFQTKEKAATRRKRDAAKATANPRKRWE